MRKNLKNLRFDDLIIRDSANYILVNKPPFISGLADRHEVNNLLNLARETDENYQLCHRLDKETSGIIVFAKNPEAYKNFAMQLENRKVKKVYHAVIQRQHKFEDFEASEPLHTNSNKSRVDFKTGKPSLTIISTLETFKKHTLIECFPITGRMHQIRVHLSFHQSPIIHDPTYGGEPVFLSELKRNFNRKKWEEEKPMIKRMALHSFQIAFRDIDNGVIEAEAPYPKDFTVLIKLLRKYKLESRV